MERRQARHHARYGGPSPIAINRGWWTHRYARDFCALLFGVGLGCWLTVSYFDTRSLEHTKTSNNPINLDQANTALNPASEGGEFDQPLRYPTSQGASHVVTDGGLNHFPQVEAPAHPSQLERFLSLINQQNYGAAMDIYAQVESHSPANLPALREALMSQLNMFLADDRGESFVGLSDAALGLYFNDIKILALVADYHAHNNEFAEALDILQLANSFAQRSAEARIVQERVSRFVQHTVSYLSNKGDWLGVQAFLEGLIDRDLSTPEHDILLAEVYFHNGFPDRAMILLESHQDTPSVASRVAKLILAKQKGKKITPLVSSFDAVVNMAKHRAHFLVPLRAEGRVDVHLLLDTGATMTVISAQKLRDIRDRHPVRYKGTLAFNTANGTRRAPTYEISEFKLGPYTLEKIVVAEMDLHGQDGIDGLLGMNILGQFHFQIDQAQGDLLLTPRD